MKTILNLLAIIVASVAHLVSGFYLVHIGRVNIPLLSEMDIQLPLISKASVAYTTTVAPIITGLMLGLVTLAGLSLINRSERLRWLLPFLLSLSFVVVILQIVFVSFGLSLPLVKMVEAMSQ